MILLYVIWLIYLGVIKTLNINFICVAFIVLIGSIIFLPNITNQLKPENTIDDQVVLKGKINSQVYLKDTSLFFTLMQNKEVKINIRYFYEKDVREVKSALKNIETGRSCVIKGKQNNQKQKSNPGQFDYAKYLADQGIHSEIVVQKIDDIICGQKTLFTPIWSIRNKLIFLLKENYSDFSSSWLIALVLGEDSFINTEVIEIFRHWNISHLLAISGLHTAIFIGILYAIFTKLLKLTIERTQILIIIALPLFTILSGAEPSVIRASFMVILFIVLNLLKIKLLPSDILSLVFISLLIINPLLINHIGFQFSFAVTFSLLISSKWLSQTNNRLIQSLQISFISQIIILPLQLHYFNVFQPLSILLNIIVIPYFTIIVIPGMFLMLISLLLPPFIIASFDVVFQSIHHLFLKYLFKLNDLFPEHFIVGELNMNHFLIYYLILFIFMWSLEKYRMKQSIIFGMAFILMIFYLNTKETYSSEGRVTMLDIGQGDAIMIELPYREGVFMIDAGSHFSFTDMKATKTVYNQVIKPYLYYRGIDVIDGVFLSHDHIDHTGSLQFLLEEFHVKEVFISPYHPVERELLELFKENKTILTVIQPTEKFARSNLQFQVLHPVKDHHDENDNSLIIYSKIGGISWLFNGDASTHNELDLIKTFPKLKVDVLKVGHHGSNTSTHETFLETIEPRYALISAGENNVYGHPTPNIIERLQAYGISVYRTDQDGAIEYVFNIKTKEAYFNHYLK